MMDFKFLFKLALCFIQIFCVYHVVYRNKFWLVPIQMVIALIAMSM